MVLPLWLSDKESICQRRRCRRQVASLGQEDPQRRARQPSRSRVLAWRILWMEESDGLQSLESQRQTPVTAHPCIHKMRTELPSGCFTHCIPAFYLIFSDDYFKVSTVPSLPWSPPLYAATTVNLLLICSFSKICCIQ